MNESGRGMEQSKTHWPRLYRHTPGGKTAGLSNEWKKKRSQTGWRRGVVTQGGGVEESPFSLHYDANCIQTPTYSAVSLTVKVPPDRQPGETHNAPSPSLLGNHKNLMSHAQNRLTFPSALQLATAYNRENTISHRWTLPSLFLKTPVKTQFLFHFCPILQQFTVILIHPVWFIRRCPCYRLTW